MDLYFLGYTGAEVSMTKLAILVSLSWCVCGYEWPYYEDTGSLANIY